MKSRFDFPLGSLGTEMLQAELQVLLGPEGSEGAAPVGHQHQARRSLTTEGFEGRIWSILNQQRLGFSSQQHVFYQDHSRHPLGFLPAL